MANLGLGKDIWTVPFDNITNILRVYYFDEDLYLTALPMVKISILLFYLRIVSRSIDTSTNVLESTDNWAVPTKVVQDQLLAHDGRLCMLWYRLPASISLPVQTDQSSLAHLGWRA